MNRKLSSYVLMIIVAALTISSSCKKKRVVDPPIDPELITSFSITLTDSASGLAKSYSFSDPDGDGGQPAFYGPDRNSQTDSVISLKPHAVYFGEVRLTDESKNPVVDISEEVREAGAEHMLFYNNGNNNILNAGNPYTVKLNGSNIVVRYTDLDNGSPQRGIGLRSRWQTADSSMVKHPLTIVLRHQPESKDGTFSPGDTDIEVAFRLRIK
jgi:hypothetical protein